MTSRWKRTAFLALSSTLLLAFSGLAAAADTFSLWVRSDNGTFMEPLVRAYNAKGGDQVKLEIIIAQEVMQKLATSYAAGQAPDAVSLDLIYTPQLINAGMLEDITDYAKSLPYFGELSQSHVKISTDPATGKIYGLPYSAESSFVIYNKNLYRQAGLDPEKPPTNWAEFEDHCVRIADIADDVYGFYLLGSGGGWLAFTFNPLIWASGGDTLSADGRIAQIDTQEVKDAIALYRRLYQRGAIPESAVTDAGANMLTGFLGEKIGLMSCGAFLIGVILKDHPEIDFGVTPIPGKDGGFATFAGGDVIVFPKGTTKLDAAKRFLEWCYSLEGQTIMAEFGSLPVRSDLAPEALATLDSRYLLPAEILSKGHTPYSLVYSEVFLNNNGPWTEMLNRGFFTDEDIDDLVREGQENIQQIIDDNY
ncbi:MAG: sugar ABC transporter substrate-binding protein [Planctomycetaceae bacterium]|nr:sugar ABC transporter substrate-binding protein [Planctomycetaceae bacterium]